MSDADGARDDVKVKRVEKIAKGERYAVSGTTPEGTSKELILFGCRDRLGSCGHIAEQTILGGFQVRADFEDCREIGGIKILYVVRWSSPRGAWETSVSARAVDLQQDQAIADEKFGSAVQVGRDSVLPTAPPFMANL